jgi:hypothetical protein
MACRLADAPYVCSYLNEMSDGATEGLRLGGHTVRSIYVTGLSSGISQPNQRQHNLYVYHQGKLAMNDAEYDAAIRRASEPPAGPAAEHEAGQ